MRSGGIEKMGGIRGGKFFGKFLLLVLGRLEKRLDRLLHRTSRNLEQPVDRSSWRKRAARVSVSVFWSLEIALERHRRFEPFALCALRHKKTRRKRPPCYKRRINGQFAPLRSALARLIRKHLGRKSVGGLRKALLNAQRLRWPGAAKEWIEACEEPYPGACLR